MPDAMEDLFALRADALRAGVRIMALRAFADADVADEIAQDTVTRVFEAVRRGRLRSPDRLAAFTWSVARHVIADAVRERRLHDLEKVAGPAIATGVDPLDELIRAELTGQLAAAFAALPAPDRTLLRLAFVDGLPTEEVARRLGVPAARCRMRKSRAVRRLREVFHALAAERYASGAGPSGVSGAGQVRRTLGVKT